MTCGGVPFQVAITEELVVPSRLKSTRSHPAVSHDCTRNPSSGVADTSWAPESVNRSTTRPPLTR